MLPIRHRLLRRLTLAASLLIVLAVAALIAVYVWAIQWRASTVRTIEAERGRLDLEAFLTRLEPGEANASEALEALSDTFEKLSAEEEATSLLLGQADFADLAADPELLDRATDWLARPESHEALAILDRSAGIERASLAQDREAAFELLVHDGYRRFGALRAARLLRLRSYVRALGERPEETWSDVALLLRAGAWVREEIPGILSWMLGNAIIEMGLDAMEAARQASPPRATARRDLRAALDRLAGWPATRGLESERAYHDTLQQLREAGSPIVPEDFRVTSNVFNAWAEDAYHAQYLETFNELIRQAAMPAGERPGFEELFADDSMFLIPSHMLVPNLIDTIDKTDEVYRRLELAGLRFEDRRPGDSR